MRFAHGLLLSLLIPFGAHAGICSAFLKSLGAKPVIHGGLSFQTNRELKFDLRAQQWVGDILGKAGETAGDAFPAVPIAMIPLPGVGNDFASDSQIFLGERAVKSKMSGILVHEWAHVMFTRRINGESLLMNFGQILRKESWERRAAGKDGIWSVFTPRALVTQMMTSAFELTFAYQELFADVAAALVLKSPDIMYHEIKLLKLFRDNQSRERTILRSAEENRAWDESIEARKLSVDFDPAQFEQFMESTRARFGVPDLTTDSHLTLAGARPYVWKSLMEGTVNHSPEKAREILDLLYRVSRDEILHRLSTGAWSLTPTQVRRRFERRLERYLAARR